MESGKSQCTVPQGKIGWALISLLFCIGIALSFAVLSQCPFSSDSQPIVVIIEQGASTRNIADVLYEAGAIEVHFV